MALRMMKMSSRMRLKTLLSLVGASIFLAFVFYVGVNNFLTVLLTLNPFFLTASFVFFFAFLVIRALRWQILLNPFTNLDLGTTLAATGTGYMVNALFPVRVGEVARAAIVSKKGRMSFSCALSTVVVERFFDLLYMFLLLISFYIMIMGNAMTPITLTLSISACFLIALGVVVIVILVRYEGGIRWLTRRTSKWAKLTNFLLSIEEEIRVSSKYFRSLKFHLLTFLVTLLNVIAIASAFWATSISFSLPAVLFGVTLFSLASVIPSLPGGMGSKELIWATIFIPMGMSELDAATSGLAVHLIILSCVLGIGAISVLLLKLSPTECSPERREYAIPHSPR